MSNPHKGGREEHENQSQRRLKVARAGFRTLHPGAGCLPEWSLTVVGDPSEGIGDDTVLAFALVGFAVEERLNPRLRR